MSATARSYKLLCCVRCGSDTTVSGVRSHADGSVFRRRRCTNPECGLTFSTREYALCHTPDRPGNAFPAHYLQEIVQQLESNLDDLKRTLTISELQTGENHGRNH